MLEPMMPLHQQELRQMIIDFVWAATDGGTKLTHGSFTHHDENLREWDDIMNYVNVEAEARSIASGNNVL